MLTLVCFSFQCGEVGHIARNCTKGGSSFGGGGGGGGYGGGYGGGGGGGYNQNKTCYSCGGVGHMSRELHRKLQHAHLERPH